MGAVSAIMYMDYYKNDSRVKGLVLDSPFSDLELLCKNYAKGYKIFDLFLSWGLDAVN